MVKDILIIAQYTQAPGEFENDRFRYIAETLADRYNQVEVEVVTMSFSHHRKIQRTINSQQLSEWKYKMTFIPVPSYEKNVSLKRLFSNYSMGNGLKAYLKQRKKPDVIYCAVPSTDAGYAAARYAAKNQVPFFVDVQDLWPEAFQLAFNVPILSDLIFMPMRRSIDYVYRMADEVFAVSKTYADRAMRVNQKCKAPHVVFLGTDLSNFDTCAAEASNCEKSQELTVAYVGTLGHSYDITGVIDALSLLMSEKAYQCRFLVIGDGPLMEHFKAYAKEKEIDAEFTGRIPYKDMVKRLVACDIAVNPIQSGAAQSIINKHGDYAASGLPVINTQENEEYRGLLTEYGAGYSCRNGDIRDMADKLFFLATHEDIRLEMGRNSRKMAEERFDRRNTYGNIIERLINNQ